MEQTRGTKPTRDFETSLKHYNQLGIILDGYLKSAPEISEETRDLAITLLGTYMDCIKQVVGSKLVDSSKAPEISDIIGKMADSLSVLAGEVKKEEMEISVEGRASITKLLETLSDF